MIGVSGSGKTTWVHSHKEYAECSTDSIIEQLAQTMGVSYSDAFDYIQNNKKFDYVTTKFFEKIRKCIVNNTDFVIDRTHLKRHIRISLINELKSIAIENGKKLEIIGMSFELPQNIIFDRLKKREKQTGKFIPKKVILEQINYFDIPTIDEGFDFIERIN